MSNSDTVLDSAKIKKNIPKYEEEYDPSKDTRPYHVYRNDIKYKNRNNIDIDRAVFDNDDVKKDFINGQTDTIDYRIKECIREKHQILDLAHMASNIFQLLESYPRFHNIAPKIEVLSANDCQIDVLEDLSMFSNLISLNISDNRLRKIPKLPDSLEELIIDNNQIQFIPYMKNIKRLRARNNDIRKIHYSNSMESLNLTDNIHLTELALLTKLYYLEIARTGISGIPAFPHLKYLDIEETRVKILPELPNLYILSCVKSELSDISKLNNLYSLVSTNSKIRKVHYMETLQKFIYNGNHQNEIQISRSYKVHRIFKNKDDVVDVLLKANPVPVNVMS